MSQIRSIPTTIRGHNPTPKAGSRMKALMGPMQRLPRSQEPLMKMILSALMMEFSLTKHLAVSLIWSANRAPKSNRNSSALWELSSIISS